MSEDKLGILAERQLNELVHALKCKCATFPISGKTLHYQFHCISTSSNTVKNAPITLLINNKHVTKLPNSDFLQSMVFLCPDVHHTLIQCSSLLCRALAYWLMA